VTAIWLLPFYPSPLKDDGYDIADYCDVHPMYGTLGDFKVLLREAHRRGLRVITELVLNHTSDQHPWFQRARHAKPGSRWRNFYVWSDDPTNTRMRRSSSRRGSFQLDAGTRWPGLITGTVFFRTSRI
jgi:maltose alpha-D-glucosyltransferase / alpha-amylase